MKKSFFKPLLTVTTVSLLAVSLAGCQTTVSVSEGKHQSPDYLQLVSEYQSFLGENGTKALSSKREMNKNLRQVLPPSLIPNTLWKYLDSHLITPNQLEEAWPSVLAAKKATAKYPAFSEANVRKVINEERKTQKLGAANYSSDMVAFFRLLFLQKIAQQAHIPQEELQRIIQEIQKAQPKSPKFKTGTVDSQISTLITQGTQNGFQALVMKPQVAHGVILQGYAESAQDLLSRVQTAQK